MAASFSSVSRDAKIGGGANHGFFKAADVPVNVAADAIKVEDGIANDLAGAVIGNVAAAIGFAEFDSFLAKDVFRDEQVFPTGVTAEREDVPMLAEEQAILKGTGFACGDQALLEGQGSIPAAKPDVANKKLFRNLQWISDNTLERAENPGVC